MRLFSWFHSFDQMCCSVCGIADKNGVHDSNFSGTQAAASWLNRRHMPPMAHTGMRDTAFVVEGDIVCALYLCFARLGDTLASRRR